MEIFTLTEGCQAGLVNIIGNVAPEPRLTLVKVMNLTDRSVQIIEIFTIFFKQLV